jgi:carboxymethylenebutenolidase
MTTRLLLDSMLLVSLLFALLPTAVAQDKPARAKEPTPGIPPDGEVAQRFLELSTRHGEWVDVALAADGGEGATTKIHTWVVYPERKDKAPVVIVIHEIFGMTDWIRSVADQLAADGFIAVAPDLLSGLGPNGGGTESFASDGVRDAIRKLDREKVAQRLDAVRTYALALPAAAPKSATVGFCWGGGASFGYATAQPKLDGAVVYYGSAPTEKDLLGKIACPVLGLYGGDDARVTATVEPTAKTMDELHKTYSHHVFEGAGHGFLRQQSAREANGKAAKEAWEKTIAFLKKQLEKS